MAPENFFVPKIANQAINKQFTDRFLSEYEEIKRQWAWEDSPEDWLEYLLSFMVKPEMMSIFLNPTIEGGGKLYFRVDGQIVSGVELTKQQYDQLVNAIDNRVILAQSVVSQFFKEGFIITQTGKRHWVSFLQTVTGVQITLSFEYNSSSINPFDSWSTQAKTVVEKMQQHPNGLMVFCHRNWSLSRQDTIYQVLDLLMTRSNQDIRVGCITESLQNIPVDDNITQICVDGSPKSWSQASSALVAQDVDIIVMRGRNQKEVVTQAITTSLEDRCVLVDISHFSAIDSLIWLFNDLSISASQIASILLGVVGSYSGLRQVCPHCLIQQKADDSLLMLLKKKGLSSYIDQKWVQGKGCAECFGTGYKPKERLTVTEAVYFNQSLADVCLFKPNPEQLRLTLAQQGFQTYFQQAVEFASQGMTTLHEAVRVGLARRCEL